MTAISNPAILAPATSALPSFGFPSDFGFRISDFPVSTILWRGHLNVWLSGLVLLIASIWVWAVYRRLLTRLSPNRALILIVPKVLVALLLIMALFEPVWSRERRDESKGRLLALVDVSSSMDVADDGRQSRAARAEQVLGTIRDNLPGGVKLEELRFDTTLTPTLSRRTGEGVRGTDLAGSLLALAEKADVSGCLGVVVLTDGGDEKVQPAKLPAAPVSIVGIGSDPKRWNDVGIAEMQAPATVEKEVEFELAADVQARAGRGEFAARLAAVPVTLEQEVAGNWRKLDEQTLDLSRLRARAKFKVTCVETGLQRYRVAVAQLPGEVSYLNNARTLTVDVQKKALHVLYFTRELGMDFKMLRSELARDPGISFTALFRTLSERFTVQGDRLAGDDELEAGFPTSAKTLRLYDCIIVGSFPAAEWTEAQFKALVEYVNDGGAVVFLGGEKSFGRGGYATTALAALFPWQVAEGDAPLASGSFPVGVPAVAAGNAMVSGVRESLERAGAVVESLNGIGSLKPGALVLLNANLGARSQPVIAVQTFGKGKALAVASNTLWKWATGSEELKAAYGLFWRQAVRDLTGKAEGGRVLAVKWNKDGYRPGEQATVEIRVAGEQAAKEARLAATLTFTGRSGDVAVEPVPAQPGVFTAKMEFRERGEYGFRLVAYQGEKVLETYEKMLPIAPLLPEGANLELDEEYLRKLAEKGAGTFVREAEVDQFVKKLAGGLWQKSVLIEKPLAESGPWYLLAMLGVLVLEWIVRRRMNLF